MARESTGQFGQSPASRLADECPARLASDDIVGETSDESSYNGGPFSHMGWEQARDFRTDAEREADGPDCVFAC